MRNDHFRVLDEAHPDAIGFNREFLVEALATSTADELALTIDAADGLDDLGRASGPGATRSDWTDAFAQLEPFTVPSQWVIVRRARAI